MPKKPHVEIVARTDAIIASVTTFVDEAGKVLEKHIRAQANLTDHSLDELEEMGHPYRIRDGGFYGVDKDNKWFAGIKKKARAQREVDLGHDIKFVHKQSGRLLESISRRVSSSKGMVRAVVGADPAKCEYLEYVVKGTRYMVPRDFIGYGALAARGEIHSLFRKFLARVRVKGGGKSLSWSR